MAYKTIRVLIVDDSSLVRNILTSGLSSDPGIEVVGAAPDPYIARDMIVKFKPHVMTLDVEMPRMDGVEFLRKLMPQYPIPVVMVSSLTQKGKQITLDALDAGAVDFVSKPSTDLARGLTGMIVELCTKIKIASTANVAHWKGKRERLPFHKKIQESKALSESTDKVIAIGASTGGTEAIRTVLSTLPATTPGVVIVQHMPAGFTKIFAERLNVSCAMQVKEAESGDRIMPGRVLVAPGEKQMKVLRSGGIYQVDCQTGEKVNGHCPSVEVLFESVAKNVGANAVGVMLTGMGADGADAMLSLRHSGARTLAQDEKSCVVFGMPNEAYKRGGAERLLPLTDIAGEVITLLSNKN